jgi:hypothetical protein
MAINLSKSFAYDSVVNQARQFIGVGSGGNALAPFGVGTGLKAASGTLGKIAPLVALNVYGFYAYIGTATGTSTYTITSTTTGSIGTVTALATATITGGQTILPYAITTRTTVSGTTTTTSTATATYSYALVGVGSGTPTAQSALVSAQGGVTLLPGDVLYSLVGTDATADTCLVWEVSYNVAELVTNN